MSRKAKIDPPIVQPTYDSVMLDLETFGNLPGCVFASLGAVEFNLKTGEIGRDFYQVISIQSALDCGLFVQGDTIEWWLKQNNEARMELLKNKKSLPDTLINFNSWFGNSKTIWGNGLGFDISILKMGYNACKIPHPWKYDAERDVRTIVDLDPSIKFKTKFEGIRHEPISDCKHQIKYLCEIYKSKVLQ